MERDERSEQLVEEPRRQEAIVVAISAWDLAQVIAWPEKLVTFRDDDPGAAIVEPEMLLDGQGHLEGSGRIRRRAVGDRQHGYHGRAVCFALNRQHDHAGSIFASLLLSGLVLAMPEIGIRR